MTTDKLSNKTSLIVNIKKANWREEVLNGLLRGTFFFALLATLFSTYNLLMGDSEIPQQAMFTLAAIYIGAVALLGVIAFVSSIPYLVKASLLLLLYYGLALTGLVESGLSGDGRVFIFAFVIIAAILFDMRTSIVALGLGIGTFTIIALLFSNGTIYIPPERLANSTSLSSWISGSLVQTLLIISVIIPITYLIRNFETQIKTINKLFQDTESKQKTLEEHVFERTQVLEHRANQLATIAQVAHDALVFQNVSELLVNTTLLISEKFKFYHAGIFLLGNKGEYAILQAASSAGGQKMLKRGHQLRVGSEGIVGATAAEKRPHIALDVGEDATYFDNPDLPETHSEMALPLIAQGSVIGVLDIQSTETQAFNQQDIEIFQTLANQIALAIQNARLIENSQENISQLKSLSGARSQLDWVAHLEHQSHRFLYTPLSIKNAKKRKFLKIEENDEHTNIPIMLREKEIGKITLKRKIKKWNPREQELISEVANQVGLAIENARLVDETREQANQDQLIAEFSTKLRETLDMDTVVKTAIEEMKKTFDLKEVEIRLNTLGEN